MAIVTLKEVAGLRHEMLGSVLSVQALVGLYLMANTMIMCFSAEGEQSCPRGSGHCRHETLSFVLSVRRHS